MKNGYLYHGVERKKGNRNSSLTCERRRVSYVKPFIYYFLQIILLVPIFGILEMDLNPLRWSLFSYAISAVWMFYITAKLFRILERQKDPLRV
jgi:hypothetical protein